MLIVIKDIAIVYKCVALEMKNSQLFSTLKCQCRMPVDPCRYGYA